MTERSRKYDISSLTEGRKRQRSAPEDRLASALTCVFPRDGHGCRSYELIFMLQCCHVTAGGCNKLGELSSAHHSRAAAAVVKIIPLRPAKAEVDRRSYLIISDVSISSRSKKSVTLFFVIFRIIL